MYTVTYGVSSDDCNSISACAYCTTCLAYSTSKRERSQFIYVCVLSLPLFFFFLQRCDIEYRMTPRPPLQYAAKGLLYRSAIFLFFFSPFRHDKREKDAIFPIPREALIYIYMYIPKNCCQIFTK